MCPESIHYDATVEAFLTRAALPVADLRARAGLQRFEVRRGVRLIGVVGVEVYGAVGLLRSLAVEEAYRRSGLGRALVERAESWAARHGVEALYLLTTTAANFFARLGYQAIPRSEAPAAIAGTPQFAGITPPTMLRKNVVSTTGKRTFLDAEYHVNAFLVNFNALDQGTDQLSPAQPIQFV